MRRRLTSAISPWAESTADLPTGWLQRCERFLQEFEPVVAEFHALFDQQRDVHRPDRGVGTMTAETALDYGCTGPVLRGSGVAWDLRRDGEPIYTRMYDGYRWEVIAETNGHYPQDHDYPPVPSAAGLGDSWHRFYVRMLEVIQSMDLARQAMDRYSRPRPVGEPIKMTAKLPKGEAYLETEAPRVRWVSW